MKKLSSRHARDGGADGFLRRRLDRDDERQIAPVGVGQLQHSVDGDVFGGQRGGELRDDPGPVLARGIADSRPSRCSVTGIG